MVAKKNNIKEIREDLSMLSSVKAIFSTRNFGREIAREYKKTINRNSTKRPQNISRGRILKATHTSTDKSNNIATSKEELIAKVASDTGYTKKATKKAVDSVFDNILETVSTGNMIRLRGFGTFGIRKRASRMARNPRTGEKIQVKAINVPFFKPVKKLKEKVKQ